MCYMYTSANAILMYVLLLSEWLLFKCGCMLFECDYYLSVTII